MSGDFESYSSAQLAAQVRQGDAEAFAALSARFLWLVRAKAHKFSGAAAPVQRRWYSKRVIETDKSSEKKERQAL